MQGCGSGMIYSGSDPTRVFKLILLLCWWLRRHQQRGKLGLKKFNNLIKIFSNKRFKKAFFLISFYIGRIRIRNVNTGSGSGSGSKENIPDPTGSGSGSDWIRIWIRNPSCMLPGSDWIRIRNPACMLPGSDWIRIRIRNPACMLPGSVLDPFSPSQH